MDGTKRRVTPKGTDLDKQIADLERKLKKEIELFSAKLVREHTASRFYLARHILARD